MSDNKRMDPEAALWSLLGTARGIAALMDSPQGFVTFSDDSLDDLASTIADAVNAWVDERNKLLALADEMENNTWYESSFDHRAVTRFARRIREALGEVSQDLPVENEAYRVVKS